jgi:signal transduction histidine kinase
MSLGLGIHGRLTALYAAAVLAALTLCGAGLYALVFRLELSSVDKDLQRAASTTAFGMKAEEAEGLTLSEASKDTEGELRIAGITLAIYDADARLLAARWEDLPPASVGRGGVPAGLSTLRTAGGEWRTLVTRQTFKGTGYLLLNAAPLNAVNRHVAVVRTAFLIIIPLTLALAVGGGWFLARSTLRPVIESQRRFMADASHELRTPVSVIRSAADVTLSRPGRSPEEYQDSITVIGEQAKRLTRLVEDLFLLARADVNGRPLMTTRFYLDDVIAECVRALDVLGREKAVQVDVTTDEDVEVNADEDLVRRMIMNLLENAVRHAPSGTRVSVGMTRGNGDIHVAVCDLGPGVPSSERERIFERFVRVAPGGGPGAGLGLPIARWIAEAHGGSLVLGDSSAQGTLFVITLPLSPKAYT